MGNDRHARHRRADSDRRRRPVDGFRASSSARFHRLVADAVAGLPSGLQELLDGVAVAVEELPPDPARTDGDGEVALARYQVGQLPERRWARRTSAPAAGSSRAMGPDRLTIHRRPIEARASSKLELVALVQEAIVFTLADHLGLDDARLDELGWP